MARYAIDDFDVDDDTLLPVLEDPETAPTRMADEPSPSDEDEEAETEVLDAAEVAASQKSTRVSWHGTATTAAIQPVAGPLSEPARSPATPTLTGRWSRLLRGTLGVSLVESTALSGRRVELPFTPAHSGDGERSIRSIMNTDSGDHEHPLALA